MREFFFSKLNGQGNDFILIDSTKENIDLSKEEIRYLCDRNFGIGADGLILAKDSSIADYKMDYYNQDGSSAEMCGNGIRCLARFILEKNIDHKEDLDIETLAGIKKIKVSMDSGNVGMITVNMGKPFFMPSDIPVKLDDMSKDRVFGHEIALDDIKFEVNLVSMGNPHCIIFTDEDLSKIPLEIWGPKLENHELFPNKTNVEFVRKNSEDSIEMRVWERGVGETLACGTGACASAVASIAAGKVSSNTINVKLRGGDLLIKWDKASDDIFLTGEVDHVYEGRFISKKKGI